MLAVMAGNAHAQAGPDAGWQFLIEPYVMFPNMKGETGIGNLPAVHVDQDPQDIFENLQFGAMLYFEARHEQWAFSSDVLYMDLGADFEGGTLINDGSVDVSQLGWELAALRRLSPWFELGVGVTFNQVDASVKFDTQNPLTGQTGGTSFGTTEEWIDPTIVARAILPFGDRWFFQARANLGGFGVGSDLMWQLQADLGYRRSDKWRFTFGYRVIDIDYDQGHDNGRFVYDVQTFGPVLRLGYSF
jgi:hypothetical protein